MKAPNFLWHVHQALLDPEPSFLDLTINILLTDISIVQSLQLQKNCPIKTYCFPPK